MVASGFSLLGLGCLVCLREGDRQKYRDTQKDGEGEGEERQRDGDLQARRRSRELQTCTEPFPKTQGWAWVMGSAEYSPGCCLRLQGHSPSLCYPHDPPQPADLGLRGRPGKSSPRPHPSCAPARPLSLTPPTPVFTASHQTPPALRAAAAEREQIRGGPAAGPSERTGRVPPAGWRASGLAGLRSY